MGQTTFHFFTLFVHMLNYMKSTLEANLQQEITHQIHWELRRINQHWTQGRQAVKSQGVNS